MAGGSDGSNVATRGKAKEDRELADVKQLIANLSAKVDSRFDKLSVQMKNIKDDVLNQLDIRIRATREELLQEISVLKERMNRYEETVPKTEDNAVAMADVRTAMEFDPDVTIVAINLPEKETEELDETVKRLLTEIEHPDITVVRCRRLQSRGGKPGIVKVQFTSRDVKIAILRSKRKLKGSREFGKTFLRTSRSHIERLVDVNFRTILKEMPGGDSFRVTGNGRIIRTDDRNAGESTRRENENRRERRDSSGSVDGGEDDSWYVPGSQDRGRWSEGRRGHGNYRGRGYGGRRGVHNRR